MRPVFFFCLLHPSRLNFCPCADCGCAGVSGPEVDFGASAPPEDPHVPLLGSGRWSVCPVLLSVGRGSGGLEGVCACLVRLSVAEWFVRGVVWGSGGIVGEVESCSVWCLLGGAMSGSRGLPAMIYESSCAVFVFLNVGGLQAVLLPHPSLSSPIIITFPNPIT